MGLIDLARAAIGTPPTAPADGTGRHRVSVVIGSDVLDGWIDYEVLATMIEPADGFRLSRPFDSDAWKACAVDRRVKVAIDGTVILEGFIDDRAWRVASDVMEISGRDKSGRLVQESVPKSTGWDGLKLDEAVKQLASPWYTSVTLSNARNRSVQRGKGHHASASDETALFRVKGKLDESHAGRVDPGQMRWAVIEQLCSSSGLLCWSSGDGRELVIGQPNYDQAVQYLFEHRRGIRSNVKDLVYTESIADMYALIEVHGSGGGGTSDEEFGDDVTSFLGTAKDGPKADGTGKNFIEPKRLVTMQTGLQSTAEAQRTAETEMKRRGFKRRALTAFAPFHGQLIAGSMMTLFAPDTLARVVIDDEMDEVWMPYACSYRGSRSAGETTEMMLVPRGTEFVR